MWTVHKIAAAGEGKKHVSDEHRNETFRSMPNDFGSQLPKPSFRRAFRSRRFCRGGRSRSVNAEIGSAGILFSGSRLFCYPEF